MTIASSEEHLPIALEAMGGDLGPGVAVSGALKAARELGIKTLLVGHEDVLGELLREIPRDLRCLISVKHAPDLVTMEDSPSVALRRKPNSSIRVAFRAVVAGEARACISAGNTGAMMAAGMFECGTLAGVGRPAIAAMIPRRGKLCPCIFLDVGANVDCHSQQLLQFAVMGSAFASVAHGLAHPRVALLSNGSEVGKGTDVVRAAAESLRSFSSLNFIGFAEGKDLVHDHADVVVCDGFVGNAVLKAMEGTFKLVMGSIKDEVSTSTIAKLGMLLARPALRQVKSRLDPEVHGGAPLLGLAKLGIVCHGSSSEWAFFNAIRVGHHFSKECLIERLEAGLAAMGGGAAVEQA